ncbi:MAG: hypothetical protein IKP73_03425 [Bacteroidales bacterium]|nr:hypothetical protein [Bacteroidales bacterium]
MKLDDKTKLIIDQYFDNISSEDLLNLLTNRYHLRINDTFTGAYDTVFGVAENISFNVEDIIEYSNIGNSLYESETSPTIYIAA